jgi:hypothetical protein
LLKHKYGIAFKLGELGDGLPSSCMSFVELELAMIVSIGSKHFLGKGSSKKHGKKSKI